MDLPATTRPPAASSHHGVQPALEGLPRRPAAHVLVLNVCNRKFEFCRFVPPSWYTITKFTNA